ncbi:hypothetical protein LTR08_005759 [Meristemomyces frigidus]|nr:hypothetical protein LTR08_005759 [Meristemomyces frigidus]
MASGSAILEQQVAALKQELKTWEKLFAGEHEGRKPGRDDIRNASISAKYREYDRLRRPTSFAKPAETPRKDRLLRPGSAHKRTALRERAGNAVNATPSKAARSGTLLAVAEEDEQGVEATPAFIRCALGPTPQKDGQVLGIFDMPAATPSKPSSLAPIPESPTVSGTPSKPSTAPPSCEPIPSATPQSSSRRRFFEAFTGTPLKRKRDHDENTPSSTKRPFATPSFLRRAFPLAPIDEESAIGAPPFKKRGLVRSLSSIIKGLRKNEDQRMDDEWDIMNDLEAEENGEAPRPAASKVLVENSQAVEMPLGPDQGPEEIGDEDRGYVPPLLDANGQPRKPWKKKGLKRQTKRTNMRPVLHKAKKAEDLVAEEESEVETVEETQQTAAPTLRARRRKPDGDADGSEASSDDDAASEYEEPFDESGSKTAGAPQPDAKHSKPAQSRQTGNNTAKIMAAKDKEAAEKSGKKAPKMVSAQAHANFRALKIKNKNSKAGGKGGKRFGRR